MGAQIKVDGRIAVIKGVPILTGAPVESFDIRAAAALGIAAVAADGRSEIHEPQHIRRGYTDLESKLKKLGARVGTRFADPEDIFFTGC